MIMASSPEMREENPMSSRIGRNIVIAVFATLIVSSAGLAASVAANDDGNATGRLSPAAEPVDSARPVVMNFTKWVAIDPGLPIMQGFVGGDVEGKFAGEVFRREQTDLVTKLGSQASGDIAHIEAAYEVIAGDHSMRALVQGGFDVSTNKARLDGVVLGGWLTGGAVHVEFQTMPCNPVQSNALDNKCYVGTITVTPSAEG
jgi:hypothetical protein